jgi:hypothetical protein
MPRLFGYSPQLAEQKKLSLDRYLNRIETQLRCIEGALPSAGAISADISEVREITQRVMHDLQEEIDRRTDMEVSS